MMKRKLIVALVALVMIASCGKSENDQELEHLAAQTRDVIVALRPAANVVLTTTGTDLETQQIILAACASADTELQELRQLHVDPLRIGARGGQGTTPHFAAVIMDQRHAYCDDISQLERAQRCSRWCLMVWTDLAFSIEQIRVATAKAGIDLPSLAQ